MGRRNRTLSYAPALYFVTTTLQDWKPLFSTADLRDAVEMQLYNLIPLKADALMGFVIMPSHVHILVGCKHGGLQLSEFMRSFKSLISRYIIPGGGSIWMKRFDDFFIRTDNQFRVKLNYIHENPVRSGLVEDAISWKWSSARFWLADEEHPVLTKDWEWLSREDT